MANADLKAIFPSTLPRMYKVLVVVVVVVVINSNMYRIKPTVIC